MRLTAPRYTCDMPTDVLMPQMGESVAEGTVVRWIKKVGEQVARDEPLFEISTDKVDAEIPSPAAGIVAEIRVKEGETVPVNSVVAVIGQPQETIIPSVPVLPTPGQPARAPSAAPLSQPVPAQAVEPQRRRSSPLVRKIAKEHDVDISRISGTGLAGRVTKRDILDFLAHAGASLPRAGFPAQAPEGQPPFGIGAAGEVQPMSVMRKRIAEHMIASRRTSAHVHSVFEVNFARVAEIREAKRADFEKAGAKLTYLPFIIKATVDALRAMPILNASIDGDNIVYHRDVNVGIAVALDWGLIVPVIKKADTKNLLDLSLALADLVDRARSKQLKPEDVADGTFTITNPGSSGALLGIPIINQPQVAILGVGNVEKRPIVVDDTIAIRPMAYLTLGFDHRLIDGAVADQFLSHIKRVIENWDVGR